MYGEINKKIEELQARLDLSFFEHQEGTHSKVVSMNENAEDDDDMPKSWTQYKIALQIDSINFKLTNEFGQLLLTLSMKEFNAKFKQSI